eukprot:COSAG01_NODE_6001_length_3907_cov_296.489233_4_plen_225_part_00
MPGHGGTTHSRGKRQTEGDGSLSGHTDRHPSGTATAFSAYSLSLRPRCILLQPQREAACSCDGGGGRANSAMADGGKAELLHSCVHELVAARTGGGRTRPARRSRRQPTWACATRAAVLPRGGKDTGRPSLQLYAPGARHCLLGDSPSIRFHKVFDTHGRTQSALKLNFACSPKHPDSGCARLRQPGRFYAACSEIFQIGDRGPTGVLFPWYHACSEASKKVFS